ncbi:hypothetical protein J3R30DRAFT_1586768 [Lentinula aciculospora]|uniref:Uncharacterized protein n=1 Tax=Lentinula aciculospora TaxID=153920 RepID=A0A9W8ZZ56_9AGAR|nr:hypothetical protein J3R30DRAFT_1586768 [Lentinula aciculospora]
MLMRVWLWPNAELRSGWASERPSTLSLRKLNTWYRQKRVYKSRFFSSTLDGDLTVRGTGAELEKRVPTNNDISVHSIPRPVVAPDRKFIRTAIGYEKEKWNNLLMCIRDNVAAAQLDWIVTLRKQNREKTVQVFTRMEKHFPEIRRFADQWAVKQLASQYWYQRRGSHRREQKSVTMDLTASTGYDHDVLAGSIPIWSLLDSVNRTN